MSGKPSEQSAKTSTGGEKPPAQGEKPASPGDKSDQVHPPVMPNSSIAFDLESPALSGSTDGLQHAGWKPSSPHATQSPGGTHRSGSAGTQLTRTIEGSSGLLLDQPLGGQSQQSRARARFYEYLSRNRAMLRTELPDLALDSFPREPANLESVDEWNAPGNDGACCCESFKSGRLRGRFRYGTPRVNEADRSRMVATPDGEGAARIGGSVPLDTDLKSRDAMQAVPSGQIPGRRAYRSQSKKSYSLAVRRVRPTDHATRRAHLNAFHSLMREYKSSEEAGRFARARLLKLRANHQKALAEHA